MKKQFWLGELFLVYFQMVESGIIQKDLNVVACCWQFSVCGQCFSSCCGSFRFNAELEGFVYLRSQTILINFSGMLGSGWFIISSPAWYFIPLLVRAVSDCLAPWIDCIKTFRENFGFPEKLHCGM
jgi:hypothetical protein